VNFVTQCFSDCLGYILVILIAYIVYYKTKTYLNTIFFIVTAKVFITFNKISNFTVSRATLTQLVILMIYIYMI